MAWPIWSIARLRRPLAANKSVEVVEAGVKPAAEEASNNGAHTAGDEKSMAGGKD